MRAFAPAILLFAFCFPLPATLIPGPNVAKAIESSDVIVVARVASGTSFASGDQISSDLVLHVDRVLKGEVTPGSEIGAHLTGRAWFMSAGLAQNKVTEAFYGIWFLNEGTGGYAVVSPNGNRGELFAAPVLLPQEAPSGDAGTTPAESVRNEIVSGLRWIATRKSGMKLEESSFESLDEDLRSMAKSTTRDAYRQFAGDSDARLRALGIRGLLEASDPEGMKLAAANWEQLRGSGYFEPIAGALMGYANDTDGEAVRALGGIALREPEEPQVRANASYALRAIHTRDAVPALAALIQDKEERVQINALSGLCLFVRNAPTVTPAAVVSMSWMQSRKPAPLLTPETQSHCFMGGTPGHSGDLQPYISFWQAWWHEHRSEIEGAGAPGVTR